MMKRNCRPAPGVGVHSAPLVRLRGSQVTQGTFAELERCAVRFGLFLQKLNIIRDFTEDKQEKRRSFWPRCLFEQGQTPVKILNTLCHETLRNDAPEAIAYSTRSRRAMIPMNISFALS